MLWYRKNKPSEEEANHEDGNKRTMAMYIRFGRAESSNHSSCKRDSIDWKQMWEDYRKEQKKYPLSKSGFKRELEKLHRVSSPC